MDFPPLLVSNTTEKCLLLPEETKRIEIAQQSHPILNPGFARESELCAVFEDMQLIRTPPG